MLNLSISFWQIGHGRLRRRWRPSPDDTLTTTIVMGLWRSRLGTFISASISACTLRSLG